MTEKIEKTADSSRLLPSERGFAAFFITILVLVMMTGIAVSITVLIIGEQQIINNIVKSSQAYYTAEAGIEDSIYRIIKNKNYEAVNSLAVGEGRADINITEEGDNRIIKSRGEVSQRVKVLETVLGHETTKISFHYGAQIAKGGLWIGANASVVGNVYSNGSIEGQGKGSGSKVNGDVFVAGALAPEADQQWISKDSDFPFGLEIGTEYYVDTAQSFIPSVSKTINRVSFYLKKVGSPPDETVRIVADNGGIPSGTSLTSGTLVSSKVTDSYSWIDVSLNSPVELTAGETYWIMIDVSKDNDNYWVWGKDSSDGYPSGTGKYTRNWTVGNPVWKDVGGDLNFKTWMGGETPTYINRVWVSHNAHVNTIEDSWIDGDAYYQTIDDGTTVLGTEYPDSPDPSVKDLPISYAQIQKWEEAACADTGEGCNPDYVITGDLNLSPGSTIGPLKVEGNLIFPANSTDNPVVITGPVWVTGKIIASNNSGIKLKEGLTYGYPIIADDPSDQLNYGKIELSNNVITIDSPQGGKLLFISTNKSLDPSDPAIWLYNNVNKDEAQSIIFSLQGMIKVENNAMFDEVTGYAIYLENNAIIVYERGLIDSNFSSGPGGSWQVIRWKEIE